MMEQKGFACFPIFVPSKTFLVGEYLALNGGPSFVLTTGPYFSAYSFDGDVDVDVAASSGNSKVDHILNKPWTLLSMRPESPAYRWACDLGLKPEQIAFVDPHCGQGGFGASTAEWIFVGLIAWSKGIKDKSIESFSRLVTDPEKYAADELNNVLSVYKSYSDANPSGADLAAQICGLRGVLPTNGWQANGGEKAAAASAAATAAASADAISATAAAAAEDLLIEVEVSPSDSGSKSILRKWSWPFVDLDFTLLRTGRKIPTHRHLKEMQDRLNALPLDSLRAQSKQIQNVLRLSEKESQCDKNVFTDAISKYADLLKKSNLLHPDSASDIGFLQNYLHERLSTSCQVIKGCGAWGLDVLLLIHDRSITSDLRRTLQSSKEIAELRPGLSCVSPQVSHLRSSQPKQIKNNNMNIWRADAPSNIALIKYMGKKEGQRPMNTSLSMTLSHLTTTVELELFEQASDQPQPLAKAQYQPPQPQDCWEPLLAAEAGILPIELSEKGQKRFLQHFALLKKLWGLDNLNFCLRSGNNFPSDCGIASSASSFAALTLAAHHAYTDINNRNRKEKNNLTDVDRGALAVLSQKGSGSSGRSLFSPWAIWHGEDSSVQPVYFAGLGATELPHQLLLVETGKKSVSSSEAHRRVVSSLLFDGRVERAEKRCARLMEIFNRSVDDLAQRETGLWREAMEIVWAEFWDMHALFETSQPSFSYMTGLSIEALRYVRETLWERDQDGPLITMDAGANIHLIYRKDAVAQAQARQFKKDFQQYFQGRARILSSC